MNKIILLLSLFFCATFSLAEEITIEGTNITFDAPNEFSSLSEDMMRAKWANSANKSAIGNESGTTTIVYEVRKSPGTTFTLEYAKDKIAMGIARTVPAVNWIQQEVMTINDELWLFLEFTASAKDADIHNIMLYRHDDERAVMINFNSTKEAFAKYEGVLRQSIQTLRINK